MKAFHRLPSRDRRAIVVGLLLVGGLMGASQALGAWRSWATATRETAAARIELEIRAADALRRLPETLDTLETGVRRLTQVSSALIPGKSPMIAAGSLASLVSGAATSAHVRLGALHVQVDSTQAGQFTRVSVRADGEGAVGSIARMLGTLERGPHALRVRELSVTQPAPAADADQAESLRITFTVEALALSAGGKERPR